MSLRCQVYTSSLCMRPVECFPLPPELATLIKCGVQAIQGFPPCSNDGLVSDYRSGSSFFGRFVGDLEVRDVLYLMTIVMVFTCCIDLVESSPCHSYGTPLSSCCYESTEGDHAMRIMLSHGLILLGLGSTVSHMLYRFPSILMLTAIHHAPTA